MDINQLLFHHQVALMTAADLEKTRRFYSNFDMAEYYTKRINQYRANRGLSTNFVTARTYIPVAELASDDVFGPAITISMQTALVTDLMVTEMLIKNAVDGVAHDHEVSAPYLGDVIASLAKLQGETRAISSIIMDRLDVKSRSRADDLDYRSQIEIAGWENEGGSTALSADILGQRRSSSCSHQKIPSVDLGSVHDLRANRIRKLLKTRNGFKGEKDD